MRRMRWSLTLPLSACLLVAASGVAQAHVVVSPEEVPPGEYEKLTVTVPTEKDIPTTEIRVEIPEGFTVSGVKPVPGWEYEFEEEGGVVTAVAWSGGEILPREFQEFEMQAQAPEEPGEFAFRATQTYEDGSVVEWSGPPDSEEPASLVRVVAAGSQGTEEAASDDHGGNGGESAASAEAATLPDSGGTRPLVYYGAAGSVVLTLVVLPLTLRRRGT